MPNTASAKKRLRQNEKRQMRNRAIKRNIRTHLRKVSEAIAAGDTAAVETAFRTAVKKADQAAAKGIIHRNAAARIKSRMSARIKAAGAAAS